MLIQNILKTYRINNHYTQEQIAEKVHVTTQAISKWENGLSIPSIDNLLILSDLYNVSIDELVQGSPYFKKPRIIGKKFNLKKGILFLLVWTLISLLFTGFGYQPIWIFILMMLVGIILVFPTVFPNYWIIEQNYIEIHQYSKNVLNKLVELVKGIKHPKKIAYSELSSVEIIYTKKTRLSPFDINPDYFYLMVNYNEKSIKLDFDSSVKDFLPQFVSFLSRKNIPVIDNSNVTDLIISGTSLYEHFNETAN